MGKKRTKAPTAKNGQPQKHETAEELFSRVERKRKGDLVKDQFYPALKKASVSVDEAKMLVRAISSLMMEEVIGTMKDRSFSEVSAKLLKKLTPNGEREKEVKALLGIFEKENMFVAREIIEGMNSVIDQMILDEMRGRKLDSLKPDWPKWLNN